MNLSVWNPFREMENFLERYSNLTDREVAIGGYKEGDMAIANWIPYINVSETDLVYKIEAHLPGVKKEDVDVEVNNNVLVIKGEREAECEEKGKKFHRLEFSYGSFIRRLVLPDNVDEKKIDANFDNGVLTLLIEKSVETLPEVNKIEIK